jgi:hypothetical protein
VMRNMKQRPLSETAAKLRARGAMPQELWRTIPAQAFDEVRRLEVACHVGMFLTTIKEWRAAIAGDAASAVRIAMNMPIPTDHFDYPTDARMTLLLHRALDGSAAAALVLAHLLRKMPLDSVFKNRLATSWLVRNFRALPAVSSLEEGPRFRRRSIAAVLLGNEEKPS